jgi:hypothetical protein
MPSHLNPLIPIDNVGEAIHNSHSLTDHIDHELNRKTFEKSNLSKSRSPIRNLLNQHLSFAQLNNRLEDLPAQFKQPQMRPWQVIDWDAIATDQIIGISPEVYLAVIAGCMNIEAPIHDYSHTSWHYLQRLYPEMAKFVGGVRSADGSLIEMGLWEKEERQHAPVLHRLYKQLAAAPPQRIKLRAKEYQPSGDPDQDLFRHGLHRITTEYGATCLYLWLMAHSTGALRNLIEELLRDEVNHMTKFLGFGLWAYPGSKLMLKPGYISSLMILLAQRMRLSSIGLINCFFHKLCLIWEGKRSPQAPTSEDLRATVNYAPAINNLLTTFKHVMGLVNWQIWNWQNRVELIWVFVIVLWRLRCWSNSLTATYLQDLFGMPPLANSNFAREGK